MMLSLTLPPAECLTQEKLYALSDIATKEQKTLEAVFLEAIDAHVNRKLDALAAAKKAQGRTSKAA